MSAQEACQKILDAAVSAPDGVPGIVFGAMDAQGKYLAKAAAGVRGLDKKDEKMTTDHIFAIYSCTKIIAAMAVMQLVEQGKIKLDEPVETIYPEINDHKMVDGSTPKTKITMRMLLSHTAGFSYTFFNEEVIAYSKSSGSGDEFSPGNWDPFFSKMPLVNEPGTKWAYGINIDVAGKILEKVTGQTLGDYTKKNIFDPLGCKEIAYGKCEYPERLASLHQIAEDGKITARDHFDFTTKGSDFHSGGAGCTSTLDDYLKVLVVLVNKGKGANGAQILKAETVSTMFEDQLLNTPAEKNKDLYEPITSYLPELATSGPLAPGIEKGWMISGLLTTTPWPTGRSAGSCFWCGLVNLYWMADPVKGVVNFAMTQMLPFGSMKAMGPWLECEGAVYASLVSSKDDGELSKGMEKLSTGKDA